jgi:predicted phosphodiesterase
LNPYTAETNGGSTIVRFTDVRDGWEQWVLLRSDAHHDSKLCNRTLETEHLQLAKARQALIVDGGDLFDAMQGKHDKRSSFGEIRPEDVREDYLGAIVDHAAEDYAPFAANWLLLARGNHESGVMSHANIDLTSQLQFKLREHGSGAKIGGFCGWVLFRFKIQETVIQTVRLRYFHGAGGNSPVTKGVLDASRQAVYLPDADIVLNGHNHQSYLFPVARERVTQQGDIRQDLAWFVRTPGYKQRGGWEIEKGHAPAPHGCAWLRFWLEPHESLVRFDLSMDLR